MKLIIIISMKTEKPVTRVESVRKGPIEVIAQEDGVIRFRLPLDASDFVTVLHRSDVSATKETHSR